MELGGEQTRDTKTRWAEKLRDLKMREFYSIEYEKMIKYVDNEETKTLKVCK